MERQKQQAAQEQANWEATFNASQQQYQNSPSNQDREYAYNLASSMLSNGVMPDSATLSAAGISTADAQNLARYYQKQAALEAEYTRAQITSKYRTGTKSSSSGSSGSGKPALTWNQVKTEIEEGNTSPSVLSAYRYYMGKDYDSAAGGGTGSGTKGLSEFAQKVRDNMKDSVAKNGSLTSAQKSHLMNLVAGHQLTNDELNAILDEVT